MEPSQSAAPAGAPAPKSPFMAFQSTSNDALWSPTKRVSAATLPPMYQIFEEGTFEAEMQAQLDKQAEALSLQHQAFSAERESWQLERERLYRRVALLESLLKASTNGHSPARSPVVSPHSGNMYQSTPPHAKGSTGSTRLASIAEVDSPQRPYRPENCRPSFATKRESAPGHIDLSSLAAVVDGDALGEATEEKSTSGSAADLETEMPPSPPQTRATLSPPPQANRHLAGHTPLKAPAPPMAVSPAMSSISEVLSDTPTKNNTLQNVKLVQGGGDGDRPLKGPLHMPELPSNPSPGEDNFTVQMLDAKLQDVIEHPEEYEPAVMQSRPSSPTLTVQRADVNADAPAAAAAPAPAPVHAPTQDGGAGEGRGGADGTTDSQTVSDKASCVSSPPPAHSKDNEADEEGVGGIKLRKKPSINFGAPLGQMNFMWKH